MKTVLKISLFIGWLCLACIASAQEGNSNSNTPLNRKNMVDMTLGGTGLIVSVNYSRTVLVKPKYFISTSAGIGLVPYNGGLTFPHQLTLNLGKSNSFFEFGVGGTLANGVNTATSNLDTTSSYYLSPIAGWRKYFKNNFVFRAYSSPLIYVSGETYINNNKILPYAGISVGYRF